ncbi:MULTISPECIES: vitamin B12 ABC transporter permease BtuC [Pectobacterium]|jgi:vitamin B12 transport system permease protein|uniref:Vitamin B12 import system permease protein BtuC n=1 Tax=Pectobacterium carotovorum subsp. carotovorum (strain PC1) TaxID=561230 RepID=C6DKP9_PECCP|nr:MULTISPECIES: vitamin B12 ABC transporter permease BtuC [Pectobacterium]ACT13500.1 transport system permease protein [Pectobacterium carotovorum subsp. carotovorum PC1]MBA0204578.1 vitamin B12 ABC transporter permease BtuC [Pectobacterium aroidearum]MBG0751834.1 Vitamin B12 import system permease protein BtuC [Pectobacterium carotovorum subsp. carotovorum PCCS1]MDY4388890.1 vitamin B12 ABC transporter permease BtuC [Pectobacterium aroidearum]UUE56103.1 vitamin B12 ABC transporter permease B
MQPLSPGDIPLKHATQLPHYSQLKQQQYRRDRRSLVLLLAFLALTLVVSLCAGERWIWPTAWLDEAQQLFVWQLRLPRTLAVMLVGASLAMSGTVMQAVFDNPLAEPGLLGVANGAGVALVLTVLLGQGLLPVWTLSLSAIAGALLITFLLLHFARRHISNTRLLLIGIALGIICSAVMTWAVYFSTSLDLRQLMYWMMGGFSGIDWRHGWLMLALLPLLLWLSRQGTVLNGLTLGEIQARQLGIPVYRWRTILVLVMGVQVGLSVALAGIIAFIGLVIPHMLRLCGLTDQRYLLSGCALAGGGVLLLADTVARVALSAAELPIGVVTATLGSPWFIWLLLRNRL